MRIIQIIDSLDAGGAERMAVNYANALSKRVAFSALAATRKEGSLKSQIESGVGYVFLNKRGKLGLNAIFTLKKYGVENKITHVHAHGSSFFTAFLLKITMPRVQVIWHDHYGLSEFVAQRKSTALKIASRFFLGIISVNRQLEGWARTQLHCANVIYLPNFTIKTPAAPETTLKGVAGKRILCMANLREQKNHLLLLDVALQLKESHPEWSFHLVGKDFNDDYSRELNERIVAKSLSGSVFLYGSKNDTFHIIGQSDLAVLASKSEGLPVALLEYGLYEKPVVVTNVGDMPLIVKNGHNGFIVPSGNGTLFYESLVALIESPKLRKTLGEALYQDIMQHHSAHAVLSDYLDWIAKIGKK